MKIAPLIVVGLGQVGRALLRQILSSRSALRKQRGISLNLLGLADSSGALIGPAGLSDRTLMDALQAKEEGRSINGLPDALPLVKLAPAFRPGTLLVDATASTEMISVLRAALEDGCGVVLANKHPLVGPWADTRAFFENSHLRYEATVGAGLPVLSTLRTLLDTGDRITAIEGVLSGTLGYLCAELEQGMSYSAALAKARASGYTEPDPREDLSGRDVARKALILARTVGWPLEMGDLTVEPLYPEELADLPADAFMEVVPTLDKGYANRVEEAQSRGQVLRYVVHIGPDGSEVGLVAVDCDSMLGALCGPDNAIAFHTERYAETPLVISGPGAGPEVTAAGVLGDIINLASHTSGQEDPV